MHRIIRFRKIRLYSSILLLLALIAAAGCSADNSRHSSGSDALPPAKPAELLVSAAASLSDSMKEIQTAFERSNPDIKLTFNLGSSGTLQQQIEQGAPADLFLSAGTSQMEALIAKGLVDAKQRRTLLKGELVVIVPADSAAAYRSVADLSKPEVKKIAIGEPASVPAGLYAKASLESLSLMEKLQPKLVPAKDVRQVLSYVETGNADAGFVYKTDALLSQKVKIALRVDPKSHPPIEYPVGIIRSTKYPKQAERLYTYLQSKEAAAIFAKYGFALPEG